jgi:hypothetical protein
MTGLVLRNDHPFSPGEHRYSMILPIGGMILLGLTCVIAGFVFWPDPKPHYDTTTEGTFPPAPAPGETTPDPAAAPPATAAPATAMPVDAGTARD